MKEPDYTKLFDVGEKITLSSDFLDHYYSPDSWEQDCIDTQRKQGSLEIIEVDRHNVRIKGTKGNWYLGISDIDLYQLEPYKNNYKILYAFVDNQARCGKPRNICQELNTAFRWIETPEGEGFWGDILLGREVEYPNIKESQQTNQNTNKHEIRLQKQKATIIRGTRPKGSRIRSSKHKASIRSGQISYTACHC